MRSLVLLYYLDYGNHHSINERANIVFLASIAKRICPGARTWQSFVSSQIANPLFTYLRPPAIKSFPTDRATSWIGFLSLGPVLDIFEYFLYIFPHETRKFFYIMIYIRYCAHALWFISILIAKRFFKSKGRLYFISCVCFVNVSHYDFSTWVIFNTS